MRLRATVYSEAALMVLLALIPILGLGVAMRDYHGGIGNKILNPPIPLLPGLLWDFIGFPALLAIPFFVCASRVIRRTPHKWITWSLAIFLSVVIFRWGFFIIWWLSVVLSTGPSSGTHSFTSP
jgi:hypothetical protein